MSKPLSVAGMQVWPWGQALRLGGWWRSWERAVRRGVRGGEIRSRYPCPWADAAPLLCLPLRCLPVPEQQKPAPEGRFSSFAAGKSRIGGPWSLWGRAACQASAETAYRAILPLRAAPPTHTHPATALHPSWSKEVGNTALA